jgi:hypothetical protein
MPRPTLIRVLWPIVTALLVLWLVSSPWCWVWIGAIAIAQAVVIVLKVYEYQIRNHWR